MVATYQGGVAPGQSAGFCAWLTDQALDFRVSKKTLAGVHFAVFGCGNSDYDTNFNAAAKGVESAMVRLGAQPLTRRGDGDDNIHIETQFLRWQKDLLETVAIVVNGGGGARATASRGSTVARTGAAASVVYGKNQQPGEVRLPLREYRRRIPECPLRRRRRRRRRRRGQL